MYGWKIIPGHREWRNHPNPIRKSGRVLDVADLVRIQTGKDFTDPLCALIALLKPGLVFTSEQLKSLPLTQQEALLFEPAGDTPASVKTVR